MQYDIVIYGSDGTDRINVREKYGLEKIKLYGLGGNDTLWYAAYMDGGPGDDIIYDGSEDNLIYGGIGNDTIVDSYGSDRFSAGSGDDYFVFDVHGYHQGDKNEAFLESGNDTARRPPHRSTG